MSWNYPEFTWTEKQCTDPIDIKVKSKVFLPRRGLLASSPLGTALRSLVKMPGRAGRNRNKDPHFYWNNIASTKPEAQSLATSLGLDLPSNDADNRAGSTGNAGLMYV